MSKQILNEGDKKIFIEAMDEYQLTGGSNIKCNECLNPIVFKNLGEVIAHSCKCGKFNGTLKVVFNKLCQI